MFTTNEIRQREGQYSFASDSYMIAAGVERMGRCDVCGHAINYHVGVISPSGRAMWVGSNCAHTLTAGDTPASVHTAEGVRDYIEPSSEWVGALYDAAYIGRDGRGGLYVRNGFLSSLYMQYASRKRLTVKQYNAANKVMKEN